MISPWLLFALCVALFVKLVGWARRRKGLALAIGVVIQICLPDPKVQHTKVAVAKRKEE